MKIEIESTSKLTTIGDVPVRHWRGRTESGVRCHVFVHRIAVHEDDDASQFEAELAEVDPPSGPQYFELRNIL